MPIPIVISVEMMNAGKSGSLYKADKAIHKERNPASMKSRNPIILYIIFQLIIS
jgi:hypothetical protein